MSSSLVLKLFKCFVVIASKTALKTAKAFSELLKCNKACRFRIFFRSRFSNSFAFASSTMTHLPKLSRFSRIDKKKSQRHLHIVDKIL